MVAQVLVAILVLLVLYLLIVAVIIPVLDWLWDFILGLLNWIWEGIIVNLVSWAIFTSLAMGITFIIAYALLRAKEQLEKSEKGSQGTPQWILFILPIIFMVGAPITAVGLFISIGLTFNAIVLLIPFFDWGHKDGGSHWDLLNDLYPFGPDSGSEIVAVIYNQSFVLPLALVLTFISIAIIQQQAKQVQIGETSQYGAVGFGLASIVIIFPLLQMICWDATSMTTESLAEAQSLHRISCILSIILVIIAVSKGVAFIQYLSDLSVMKTISGAVDIVSPPSALVVKSTLFGLSISASCYGFILSALDSLDGTGISGISAPLNGVLAISIGLFILVFTLMFSIRSQIIE